MTIHKRIRERRIALGMSMEQLAELSGVSSWQTVQQWEREGGTAPKRTRLTKVAAALQCTPEWLMTGRDPQEPESAMRFADLNGIEAQLVMFARSMSHTDRDELLQIANNFANKGSDRPSAQNPYPKKNESALEKATAIRVRAPRNDKLKA